MDIAKLPRKILQKLVSSNIAHKIGCGYAVTIGIASIGTAMGLFIGEYYQTEAQQKLILVDQNQDLIQELQNHVLILRFHPQQLIPVADNSIWLQYEKDKFQANNARINTILSELKVLIHNNPKSIVDIQDYQNLVREYEQTVQDYFQLIESLWKEMDSLNSSTSKILSTKEQVLETIQSEGAMAIEIKFERLSEKLISIANLIEIQDDEANQQLIQADVLKRKIIIISMLLSVAISVLLAQYTSKAIASPLQKVTRVAEKVTRQSDFDIQAQINTQDEVGLLADAFNQLIAQVKNLLAEREAEVIRQKQQSEELQKAKEAADAASRAKSEFIANMSHELRTPLNGILGYAQILSRDRTLTSRQRKGLKIIQDSGNHLLTLINDILDISKIEARKLELFPQDMHLATFLSGLENIVGMRAREKNLVFKCQALTSLPTGIIADEKRLRQILLNLLSNAIKFTDLGQITLNISSHSCEIPLQEEENSNFLNFQTFCFEVIDTGIGINAQQLDKIFQAFEQVSDKKRQDEGTGLGLAISKQLVELMGGKLQVYSALGQGSMFWFEIDLPVLATVIEREARENKQHQIVGYQGRRKHLLVVDNQEKNRSILVNMLAPLGFEVSWADNGQQAVELTQTIKPDCILLDLVMPVKTGFEAIKEIRNLPELKEVIIIAISASVLDMEREKSRRLGYDSFLPKPVEAEKLLALLQEHLQLEWIYEEGEEFRSSELVATKAAATQILIVPPLEEMEILYELAMLGSMKKIRERAIYLQELDEQYAPLAAKLQDLAQGFQEKAIVNLIEQFL